MEDEFFESSAMYSRSSMGEVSPEVQSLSRKNHTAILQRLASVGQVHVARGLGCSEATVSRMKDNDLERICTMLALLGLRAVPKDEVMDRERVGALLKLAQLNVNEMTVDDLKAGDC